MNTAGIESLLARVGQTFGTASVADAIPRKKQIVFMDVHAASEAGAAVDEVAAQRAVDALRYASEKGARGEIVSADELPSAADLEALEICIRFMRPSLYVQRDKVSGGNQLALTPDRRAAIEGLLHGIASIGFAEARKGIATGFLVSRRALVTNVHVLDEVARRGRALEEVVVRFDLEWDAIERTRPVKVKGELARHPSLDLAILELVEDGPMGGLPLAKAASSRPNDRVLVVGHPLDDGRVPLWAKTMFAKNWGVKRAAPGIVLRVGVDEMAHDASTLGGNSGSPVIDLQSGTVIGVHSSGKFALENKAVPSSAAANEPRVCSLIDNWV